MGISDESSDNESFHSGSGDEDSNINREAESLLSMKPDFIISKKSKFESVLNSYDLSM